MATLIFVMLLGAVLVGIGRARIPARERLPLASWSWHDVIANAGRGMSFLCSLNNASLDERHPRRGEDDP